MSIEVRIPTVLRKHVGGERAVSVEADDLQGVVDALSEIYPGLRTELITETGEVHRFINLYVNDEDARYLDGMGTKVADGDVVAILPAVAGGW